MKVTMSTTGGDALRQRLEALNRAGRDEGQVFWRGARNAKLGQIHAHGAVLRQGASTALRTTEASDVSTRQARRAIERTAAGRARVDRRASGSPGVLPARNPHFVHQGDLDRVRRILRDGVRAIVTGRAVDLAEPLKRAARVVADAFRRNIAPDGRMGGAHRGLHEPVGTTVGEGERMAALSPKYAAQKRKAHGDRPVLVATGELRESIQSRVERRG